MKMVLTSEEQHIKMTETTIPKLVTKMAIPTVVGQLIMIIYNTADTYFVAHIGTSASAAVGVVFSVMAVIQAVGFGISMGANSIISRKLGEKKNEEAERFANSAFFLAITAGALLLVIGLTFLRPMMSIIGATKSIMPYACEYGRMILLAAPIMCGSFVLNNILRAEGEAFLSMCGLTAGGILNILLDPLFIFGLHMEVFGAALATFISQFMSFGILLVFFISDKSIIKLNKKYISRNPEDYMHIVATGFPTVCRQGLASVASACLNNQAGIYGDAAIAAVTIANKVYMLMRSVVLGIGQGYQPVAGYNYGAGKKKRVKSAFAFCCLVGTVLCSLGAILFVKFAPEIIAWFRDDADVITIGKMTLYYYCLSMPLLAYSTFVNQTIQCLGYSKQATFLASCRQGIFFIPLVFTLPRVVGITGIESVQAAADLLTFVVSVPFQIIFFKKHLRE